MALFSRNDKISCVSMNILSKCMFVILFPTQNTSLKTFQIQLMDNHNDDDLLSKYYLLSTVLSAFHALTHRMTLPAL